MYEKNWLILSSRVMGVARWKALSIFPVLLMGREKWCFPEEWIPRAPARHQDSTTLWHTKTIIKLFTAAAPGTDQEEGNALDPGWGGGCFKPFPCSMSGECLAFTLLEGIITWLCREVSISHMSKRDPTVSGVLKSVKINWNGFNHENIFRMSGCLLPCLGLVPFSPPAQFMQSLPIHFF